MRPCPRALGSHVGPYDLKSTVNVTSLSEQAHSAAVMCFVLCTRGRLLCGLSFYNVFCLLKVINESLLAIRLFGFERIQ